MVPPNEECRGCVNGLPEPSAAGVDDPFLSPPVALDDAFVSPFLALAHSPACIRLNLRRTTAVTISHSVSPKFGPPTTPQEDPSLDACNDSDSPQRMLTFRPARTFSIVSLPFRLWTPSASKMV